MAASIHSSIGQSSTLVGLETESLSMAAIPEPALTKASKVEHHQSAPPPLPEKDTMPPKKEARLQLPWITMSNNMFFSSDYYEPRLFNAWRRRNGFSKPVHILTIISMTIWFILTIGYFGYISFFIPLGLRIVSYIAAGALTAIQGFFMWTTMLIDPQDAAVTHAHTPRNIDYVKVSGIPVIDQETQMCGICNVKVDHDTKHCKPCNKCVSGYDHHCGYLNTCIGRRNYFPFCICLILAGVVSAFYGAVAFWGFSWYFNSRDAFDATVAYMFNLSTNDAPRQDVVLTGILVYGCLAIFSSVSVVNLLCFHSKLWILGLTTLRYLEAREAIRYGSEPNPYDPRPIPEISVSKKVKERLVRPSSDLARESTPMV
ncbi:hypothetical protein SmJEL517_g02228 [Synchytrium microbalum]|uniref:Palmitoyltransferase n=1 Tax=Synchytrium microbalum TaxID=1806994 RepID=A0A507C1H3_9FUNG|nr:uncharacterized protein SmJEL517_g02228 [Synchytrium microbalum]TPX35370.1 hypothetical protein SmJEL517_g02228 [Synchytrium microbalum]